MPLPSVLNHLFFLRLLIFSVFASCSQAPFLSLSFHFHFYLMEGRAKAILERGASEIRYCCFWTTNFTFTSSFLFFSIFDISVSIFILRLLLSTVSVGILLIFAFQANQLSICLNFGLICDLLPLVGAFMGWFFYFSNLGVSVLNFKMKGVGSSLRIFSPTGLLAFQMNRATQSFWGTKSEANVFLNMLSHVSFGLFQFSLGLPSVRSHLFFLRLLIFSGFAICSQPPFLSLYFHFHFYFMEGRAEAI